MHSVIYDNASSSWSEALPLGNGVFGAMAFYEDNKLTLAMNHYEVYYKKLSMYSQKSREGIQGNYSKMSGHTIEEFEKIAEKLYRDPEKGPFFLYSDYLSGLFRRYGKPAGGVSHYPTGEINIIPSDCLKNPEDFSLRLEVEEARIALAIQKEESKLNIKNIIAKSSDYLISEIEQNNSALIKSIEMYLPFRRYQNMTVEYKILDDSTFYYIGSFYPDGEDKEKYEPFKFIVMMKIVGAKGRAEVTGDVLKVDIFEAEKNFKLITTVVTEEETDKLIDTAKERLQKAALSLEGVYRDHKEYWRNFWDKSSVILPDKMIEDLWHINLYSLACCSGKGGRMYQQACGLNGLWDIKQPNRWGSSWYWDVNIQAAFWPTYTSNHLEIAEAFNDGLLSYTSKAEKMAKEFHGLEGYASDYPHALYLSTWAWCAQFLWYYYRYSMDKSFLKEKAYPFFKNVVKFFDGYLKYDTEKEEYYIFPDIAPEQGPFTKNTTITVATVKYLLKISIEANKILEEDKEELARWTEILEKMPGYPIGISKNYGKVIRDSEWAPAELHLRHPSLLMPIYPIGEINKYSDMDLREIAENTLCHAEENTEIGVFQFGWLSCTASRLGKGNTALRLLYEQGIDLLLRPNGLFSEETERYINYCNITAGPVYYPNMMEATGEMVASVNEMLLQSYGGIIEVFPAVPSGELEKELTIGMYDHFLEEKVQRYKKWSDCSFKALLAEGAFEVSAKMTEGLTKWVKIKSLAGSSLIMRNPFTSDKIVVRELNEEGFKKVEYSNKDNLISFLTDADNEYIICLEDNLSSCDYQITESSSACSSEEGFPRIHEAHTHRRVYLGKNKDTEYIKKLDNFTFDYYAGNYRESRTAIYRLDFSTTSEVLFKDYRKTLPKQFHMDNNIGQNIRRISINNIFTIYTGIGWENNKGLSYVDRDNPDEFRRDFIAGSEEKAFYLELPKGAYDILIVSGDSNESSYTEIEVEGQSSWKPEGILAAGQFATEILPIVQRKDGYVKINFKSCPGHMWRINAMIVNKNYSFL
jgi:hypothetical protein